MKTYFLNDFLLKIYLQHRNLLNLNLSSENLKLNIEKFDKYFDNLHFLEYVI